MEKRVFDYYATIIYSEGDERWAKWVQRKLERYRFPVSLRQEHTELPSRIFPVFRDNSKYSGDVPQEGLEERLEQSEYLIVVCSPESAQVDWLDREIRYFQALGRNRNIIPLIVDGEPHAKESVRECYSPALLNKGEDELLGVSVRELGRRQAVLRIIASLMHLRFDQLVMRDKRRAHRRRLTAAGVLAALFIVSAGVVWYETPHSACYRSYVYRDELPVGLVKIGPEAQRTAHDYYRIVTCRNKVIRLERINSSGEVTDSLVASDIDDFPVTEFTYNEKGRLKSATKRDVFGNVCMVKDYTQDLGTVDLRYIENSNNDNNSIKNFLSDSGFKQGEPSCFESIAAGKEITRYWLEYDARGYLIREVYLKDRNNTLTCDENGIYGKAYLRDERDGKILRVTNLGEDGEPLCARRGTGVAYTDYEYDAYGRVAKSCVYDADGRFTLDKDGVFYREYLYSDSGSLAQMLCRDAEGRLCADRDGIAQYFFVCDEKGRLAERYGQNESGNAVYAKSSGVYRTVYEAEDGICSEAYYGADGSPIINNCGYARQSLRYDIRGRIVERWVYGLDQKLTYDTAGGNCAGYTVEYPDEDTVRYICYNAEGEAAPGMSGYVSCTVRVRERSGWESVVEKSYYDAAGNPVRARDNAASVVYQYDDAGRLVSEAYFDEMGAPCGNYLGASVIRYNYRDKNMISREYFDAEGVPCCVKYEGGNYAKVEIDYDLYDRATRIRCYDGDSNRVHIDGVWERQIEYDEGENCIRYKYCDNEGMLMDNAEGYAVREYKYDESGAVIRESYWNSEDIVLKEQEFTYDGRGNLIGSMVCSLDGNGERTDFTTEYEYDERNRAKLIRETADAGKHSVVKENCYDENNRLERVDEYAVENAHEEQRRSLTESSVYTYDVYGNRTQVRRYDGEGQPIADSAGIAYTTSVYNVMGDRICETCRNVRDEIMAGPDGYAIVETVFDAAGRPVLYRYLDEEGVVMAQAESGLPAYKSIRWNDAGRKEEEILLNESGEYLQSERYDSPRTVFTYNDYGVETIVRHYDCENQLTDTQVCAVCVVRMEADSEADKAGFLVFDVLIQYGDWYFFNYEDYADTSFVELDNAIISGYKKEKTIETGRVIDQDDSGRKFRFTDHRFEAGGTGMRFTLLWIDLEEADQMKDGYRETDRRRRQQKVVKKLIEYNEQKANGVD